MATEVLYNSNMHFEHQQWNGELAFWKQEITFFNKKLIELVSRWTNKEVLAQLEHYQNQFIVHNNVIDDLQEIIEKHETRIAGQSKTNTDALDVQLTKEHVEFRNKIETQRHVYSELKKDFFRFLEKYM